MKMPPALGTQPGDIIKWGDIDHSTRYHGLYPAQFRAAAAEWYAERGLEVGPLNGKVPVKRYVPHGFKDFTADVDTVREWWRKLPGANIGLRPPAGYVVIDVDVRDGAPGARTWRELTAGRAVPGTLTMVSGSGGWHFWFRLPHEGKLRKNLMHLTSGIDVKHHGGYLVAAPSVHPDTGGLYQLYTWMEPEEIPHLPAWLICHVYAPEVKSQPRRKFADANPDKRIAGLVRTVEDAPPGSRNNTLIWAACRNAEHGLGIDEELVAAAMRAGLPEREARVTVASGARLYRAAGGVNID